MKSDFRKFTTHETPCRNFERTTHNNEMHRLTSEDYAVDAVTMAKALVGARVKFTSAPRIGIAYASKRDQNRKWRFTLNRVRT